MNKKEFKEYIGKLKQKNFIADPYLQVVGGLLYCIRLDFSNPNEMKRKCDVCIDLLNKLDEDEHIKKLKESIEYFRAHVKEMDGRYFRYNFPEGYYGIMPGDMDTDSFEDD